MTIKVSTTAVSTSGLGFQLNRLVFKIAYLVLLYPLVPQVVLARSWVLSERIKKQIESKTIFEMHSDIKNASDLQNLLKDLGRSFPFIRLEADLIEDVWVISGALTEFVGHIEVKLATSKLEQLLESIKLRYIGRTDSQSLRSRVIEETKEILENKGYPHAKIRLKAISRGKVKHYFVEVDEKKPCIIQNIEHHLELPKQVQLDLKAGDVCSETMIKAKISDLEYRLLGLGYKDAQVFLQGISFSSNGLKSWIKIGGQTGRRVLYKIEDQSNLFLPEDIFSEEKLDARFVNVSSPEVLLTELNKFYKSKGYEDVDIEKPIQTSSNATTDTYTVNVKLGAKYTLNSLIFEGNQVFSASELENVMELRGFLDSKPVLDRDELSSSIDVLKHHYRQNGYWDVIIQTPRITKDKTSSTAQVVIQINENKPRILQLLNIKNNRHFSDSTIKDLAPLKIGKTISKSMLLEFEDKIKALYIRTGFKYVELKTSMSSRFDFRTIPTIISVDLTEGRRVKIGKTTILGLIETQRQVVTRELLFKEGDWYNPETLRASRNALMSLGIFKSVQIVLNDHLTNLGQAKTVDISIQATEGYAGSLSFGPGYNYSKGMTYLGEFSYNNLWGTGRQISVRASISEEKDQKSISNPTRNKEAHNGKVLLGRKIGAGYVEPYIWAFPVNGKIGLSHQGVSDDIWKISNEITLSLNYKTKQFLAGSRLTTFYNYKVNREIGSRKQEAALRSTGDSTIGSVGASYLWDRRKEISWPTGGDLIQGDLRWARPYFGGQFKYFRWDFSYKRFTQVLPKFVWATSISMSSYARVERSGRQAGGVLPYTERLQAGGATKVRGYESDLGPYVLIKNKNGSTERYVTGGTKQVIVKTDFRFKLVDSLASSFFLDSGNTFFSEDEIKKYRNNFEQRVSEGAIPIIEENIGYEFHELIKNPGYLYSRHYLAYGVSMSLITPIGPLNAFLSWPWREPKSLRCIENKASCYSRARQADPWYKRYKFNINIGTEF